MVVANGETVQRGTANNLQIVLQVESCDTDRAVACDPENIARDCTLFDLRTFKGLCPSRSRLEHVFRRPLAASDAAIYSTPVHGLRCTSIRAHPSVFERRKTVVNAE